MVTLGPLKNSFQQCHITLQLNFFFLKVAKMYVTRPYGLPLWFCILFMLCFMSSRSVFYFKFELEYIDISGLLVWSELFMSFELSNLSIMREIKLIEHIHIEVGW